VLNLTLQISLLWPHKTLSLPSSVNKTLMSIISSLFKRP